MIYTKLAIRNLGFRNFVYVFDVARKTFKF